MVSALILSSYQSYDNQYLINLLLTPDFGFFVKLSAYVLGNHPHAMKLSITHYPYTPQLHEAMSGEHGYYSSPPWAKISQSWSNGILENW